MTEPAPLSLTLTPQERETIDALAAGIAVLAEQPVSAEAAVVAAAEMGVTRLLEDFELPDPAVVERLTRAREGVRMHWNRGDAHL